MTAQFTPWHPIGDRLGSSLRGFSVEAEIWERGDSILWMVVDVSSGLVEVVSSGVTASDLEGLAESAEAAHRSAADHVEGKSSPFLFGQ